MRDNDKNENDGRGRILDGARAAFLRFGFDRASIADIAHGAGVSRTAVYHYFPGKDEIFQAVIKELHARSLALANEALESNDTLDATLLGLFEAKFGRTLAVITESPHGVDLVDSTHRVTGAATRTANKAFHALVVKAFVRHGRPKDADAVADTLIAAAKGLMRAGETHVSKAKYEARLKRLIDWVMN